MKFNNFALFSAASALIALVPFSSYAVQNWSYTSNSNHTQVLLAATPVALMSGNFIAGEAPTTGTAKIVEEGGMKFIEFDSSFSTSDQGPDLHVLLDVSDNPPQSYESLAQTINLGALKSFTGTQKYPIPDAIDVSTIKSVVIWCRMANATFGYAPLQ